LGSVHSVTAFHRFIPKPALGLLSVALFVCIFSIANILVFIVFTRFDFQNPDFITLRSIFIASG